jgi:uncharacterized protein (TIGR03435 family)
MWKTAMMMLIAISFVLAQRLEFEVASVKVNKNSGPMSAGPQRSGDLVTMRNTRLYTMIYYAFHLDGRYRLIADQQPQQWWDWYDIEAKAPVSTTEAEMKLMMQSLLEDRFKLKVHRETRELASYRLAVTKSGPKLKSGDSSVVPQVDGRPIAFRPGVCMQLAGRDGDHLICGGTTMEQFVSRLANSVNAPVVDETGLTGKYNFELIFTPPAARPDSNAPEVDPAPTLTDALQRDLGLKLEKGKAPVEVLVVDHVERPSAN